MRRRDVWESVGFDALLILTGIFTLPITRAAAMGMAQQLGLHGWWVDFMQALLLFVLRALGRYIVRRWFRRTEA